MRSRARAIGRALRGARDRAGSRAAWTTSGPRSGRGRQKPFVRSRGAGLVNAPSASSASDRLQREFSASTACAASPRPPLRCRRPATLPRCAARARPRSAERGRASAAPCRPALRAAPSRRDRHVVDRPRCLGDEEGVVVAEVVGDARIAGPPQDEQHTESHSGVGVVAMGEHSVERAAARLDPRERIHRRVSKETSRFAFSRSRSKSGSIAWVRPSAPRPAPRRSGRGSQLADSSAGPSVAPSQAIRSSPRASRRQRRLRCAAT